MSLFGWIFWGGLIGLVILGYLIDKKYRSNTPKKSANQVLHETSALKNNQRYHNGNGGPNV
jgi:hypothetical protein